MAPNKQNTTVHSLRNIAEIAIDNNLDGEAGKNIAILSIEFLKPRSSVRAVKYCFTIGMGIEGIEVMMENH